MKLSNKAYDIIKFCVTILFPALGTLYFVLAGLWNLPLAEEVVGTLSALAVFGGALIGISSNEYKKTHIDIELEDEFEDIDDEDIL